ncbi:MULTISPECIES: hypothetical protein [unclassified Bradyrhizobium]
MDEAGHLDQIADEMDAILSRFSHTRDGLYIADGDEGKFTGLVLRAKSLMTRRLGLPNDFAWSLERTRIEGVSNYLGSQSFHSVEQSIGIVRAAADTIRSEATLGPRQTALTVSQPTEPPYVSPVRIGELRAINSTSWDLRKLVRLSEEINAAFAGGNFLSVAMLLRAIADHVPPIFGAPSFREYASNCAGRSHKGSMQHLDASLRHIADGILHQQIRARESLPTASQVDFRQDLDVLLGEVVRVLR